MIQLSVSRKNSKIGYIPSVSLTPWESCEDLAPCSRDCYARNSYVMYPAVRKAWDQNLKLWNESPESFRLQLERFLWIVHPKRFLWHVGGDIPNKKYFDMMWFIAANFKDTEFLCFTRRRWAMTSLPNLHLVQSHWLGDDSYIDLVPNAYVRREGDDHPSDFPYMGWFCPGKCSDCGHFCWSMKGTNAVYFTLHGNAARRKTC